MKMFRTKILCITRDSNTGIYQIMSLIYLFKFYSVEEVDFWFSNASNGFLSSSPCVVNKLCMNNFFRRRETI